jgi:ornithine carbamoyltransferase
VETAAASGRRAGPSLLPGAVAACAVGADSCRSAGQLAPYEVNADLMRKAMNPAVKFMHCLPPSTTPTPSWDENRLHTIKAILVATLG